MLMIAQALCQTRWQCNSACITTAKLAQELRENQKDLNLINTVRCAGKTTLCKSHLATEAALNTQLLSEEDTTHLMNVFIDCSRLCSLIVTRALTTDIDHYRSTEGLKCEAYMEVPPNLQSF